MAFKSIVVVVCSFALSSTRANPFQYNNKLFDLLENAVDNKDPKNIYGGTVIYSDNIAKPEWMGGFDRHWNRNDDKTAFVGQLANAAELEAAAANLKQGGNTKYSDTDTKYSIMSALSNIVPSFLSNFKSPTVTEEPEKQMSALSNIVPSFLSNFKSPTVTEEPEKQTPALSNIMPSFLSNNIKDPIFAEAAKKQFTKNGMEQAINNLMEGIHKPSPAKVDTVEHNTVTDDAKKIIHNMETAKFNSLMGLFH